MGFQKSLIFIQLTKVNLRSKSDNYITGDVAFRIEKYSSTLISHPSNLLIKCHDLPSLSSHYHHATSKLTSAIKQNCAIPVSI